MSRSLAIAAALVLAAPAPADDESPYLDGYVEDTLDWPGLVVYELTKPGACEEPGMESDAVAAWLTATKSHAMIVDRTKRRKAVPLLVQGGREVMPMRIAYYNGKEIDRMCGCAKPAELLTWMTGLSQGKTGAEQMREKLGDPTVNLDVQAELDLTRLHYCANRPMEGFETLKTLWELIPEKAPDYREIRLTRVAHDMAVLARKSDEVTAGIEGMRDALEMAKDDAWASLDDWVALNRVLLDDERTYAWFDKAIQDPELEALAQHQAPNVWYMLAEDGKWKRAGALIDDPKAWLDRWKKMPGGLVMAVDGYASLLAAGRAKDASKIAKSIIKVTEDGTACTMLARTLEVATPDASQKPVAKACDDEATVAAWEGALP